MLWIILLVYIILWPDAINGQTVLTPPKNCTGILHGDAYFTCQVEFDAIQKFMSWEFNNDHVYVHQYSVEDYPKGHKKYSVTKETKTFMLTVKDLNYDDAGKYTCAAYGDKKTAMLLVLDTPQLFNSTPNPVEGSIAEFICSAQFGGPSKEDISPDHYPQFQMFLDGEPLNGTVMKEEPEGARNYYNITQISQISLAPSMNGKQIMCKIKTSSPSLEKSITMEVTVLLPQDETTTLPDEAETANNSWKIAVGIIILVSLLIAGLTAFYCHVRHKNHYKSLRVEESSTDLSAKNSKNNISSKYEDLVKTIANLTYWEDLDDATVGKIAVFLTGIDDNLSVGRPTALYQLINKSGILIQSGNFIGVTMAVAQKFAKNHEDPLLYLVEFLEKNASLLTQHPENFMKLVKVLQQYDGPSDTRSQCLRVLLMGTREWRLCNGELSLQENKLNTTMDCQFSLDFIDDLVLLLKNGANPAWSPEGSPEGSNLHVLMLILQYVIANKSSLFEKLIELLERMTDASMDCSNVDSEGRTILHNLVDFRKLNLQLDCLEHFVKTIALVRMNKFALLDATDNLKRTPLHTFVIRLLQGHSNNSAKSETGTVSKCKRLWQDHKEGLLQVFSSLITPTNTDIQCNEGKTPLLDFTGCAQEWADHPEVFLEVVKCLKSPSNLDLESKDGTTALHCIASAAGYWTDNTKTFIKVLKCVKSAFNINFHAEERGTPLLIFTIAAEKWVNCPDAFFKIVKSLKSPKNIDFQTENGNTPLLEFTIAAKKWSHHSDVFFQVVENLKSDFNIDYLNLNGQTPLHYINLAAKEWAHFPVTFLKVVQLLISESNINIPDNKERTPLCIFSSAAISWRESPDLFLEVVKCLKSDSNIDFKDKKGNTPLYQITNTLKAWTDHLDIFFEMIKLLKSSSNINIHGYRRCTALHIVATSAVEWVDNPDTFLKVIQCLKSPENVDIETEEGDTALHFVILAAEKWARNPEIFLEVVKCLKSDFNIDFKDKKGNTPLHQFTNALKAWTDHLDTFFEMIKLLKSSSNINIQGYRRCTALHIVATSAVEWVDKPDTFLKVIQCLKSPENVDIKTEEGDTALNLAILAAKKWARNPEIFLEVVKCLKSVSNINFCNKNTYTPIYEFISAMKVWKDQPKVFLKIIKCLVSPCNVDLQTSIGWTPLHVNASVNVPVDCSQ